MSSDLDRRNKRDADLLRYTTHSRLIGADAEAVRAVVQALMDAPLPFVDDSPTDTCRYCNEPFSTPVTHRVDCWWPKRSLAGTRIPNILRLMHEGKSEDKTYTMLADLHEQASGHKCSFGCDSPYAVNCNCEGKCPKHPARSRTEGEGA